MLQQQVQSWAELQVLRSCSLKKLFIFIFTFLILQVSTICATYANEIDRVISQNDFELKSTIGILAVDKNSDKVIYEKHAKKLLNPASLLKALTFSASYFTLSSDYEFKTALYKDSQNNLYVKLGADPLLTSKNLVHLFKEYKEKYGTQKINAIYIDDTIIDKTPYPDGWMEDDIWPVSPAITPYIVDKNTFEITISRSSLATKVDILQNGPYKLPIINELVLGDKQDYKIEKMYGENSSIVSFKGTIAKDEIITMPVLNPELNFKIKLADAIRDAKINYYAPINVKKVPYNATPLNYVSHTIDEVSVPILHNSDNFAAEVVFKAAGAKYIKYSHPATLNDAINMYYSIFPARDCDGIKIADGSGVSRYNLVSCDYVIKCFKTIFGCESLKNLFATSNQGTLKERLGFLEGNLRAKTGTLSGVSSIAGILTSRGNREIIFVIITQNSPKRKAILKNFENTVISILYRKH